MHAHFPFYCHIYWHITDFYDCYASLNSYYKFTELLTIVRSSEGGKRRRRVRRSWRQPHLIKFFYDNFFPVEQFLRCWLIKERERKIGIQLKHRIHWYSNFTSSLFPLHNLLYLFLWALQRNLMMRKKKKYINKLSWLCWEGGRGWKQNHKNFFVVL